MLIVNSRNPNKSKCVHEGGCAAGSISASECVCACDCVWICFQMNKNLLSVRKKLEISDRIESSE